MFRFNLRNRRIILFITLMLLGVVMAMQGKSILNYNGQQKTVANRISEYKELLLQEQEQSKALREEILKNQEKKDAILKELAESNASAYLKFLGEELDKARFLMGMTAVKGRGVKVILKDAPAMEIENPNLLLIHDSDVIGVLNELKKAGAQAISINGERIISTTEQVCAGPTIRINKNRYPVPYEISAIGDPKILFDTLDQSKTVALMRDYEIVVEIKPMEEVKIPPYHYKIESLVTGLEVVK